MREQGNEPLLAATVLRGVQAAAALPSEHSLRVDIVAAQELKQGATAHVLLAEVPQDAFLRCLDAITDQSRARVPYQQHQQHQQHQRNVLGSSVSYSSVQARTFVEYCSVDKTCVIELEKGVRQTKVFKRETVWSDACVSPPSPTATCGVACFVESQVMLPVSAFPCTRPMDRRHVSRLTFGFRVHGVHSSSSNVPNVVYVHFEERRRAGAAKPGPGPEKPEKTEKTETKISAKDGVVRRIFLEQHRKSISAQAAAVQGAGVQDAMAAVTTALLRLLDVIARAHAGP